ncbi:developmentally-regulated GTP-binding protein 2 isoform X2 [Lepidochelys kempii]|uniref:developmentally-regulated GTP-binding protein 2 isoform X2 n=1 Tax=Lepidochelys kempii TaxID=8472 RepID=UPI003C6EB1A6
MGILEKISEIEKEIARTQKNKATEYHLGLLKAKLAKYRAQLLEPSKSAAAKGEGFDVMKSGDARVALIGFPSVGKSTFLSLMTSTASEAASYEFTTLTCIPGVIEYKGANIQLLDLPGIIEGAAQGKGRGRQVIAVARTADVVIMMLDATKGEVQRSLLEKELESVGIRLNKCKPNIYFKPKKGGGISFNSTVTLTQCSEKLVQLILHEYKIFNAEVLFREDCSPDEFIDVIVGNRVYMPCLYVYNKIDQISMEEVDRLARRPNSVVIRETGLHRCHYSPERGFCRACVPSNSQNVSQPVQICLGVGNQHKIQSSKSRINSFDGARRCHPDCQEVTLLATAHWCLTLP